MKSKIIFLGILLLISFRDLLSQNALQMMKSDIQDCIAKSRGTYAVAYLHLANKETVLINEKEVFHAASTMKTPVMIEIFKQAAEGKFSLADSLKVRNEFRSIIDGSPYSLSLSDDSEDGLYGFLNKNVSIRDLVIKMITVSSNLATNILIDTVTAAAVTATMRSYGANDIQVLRGVEDTKAFLAGKSNTTTAYDLMIIFEAIAKHDVVSEQASSEMIEILLAQKFNDMIPALLPSNITVAHKTGSITGVQHDSGIVFLPNGQAYVLVVLSKDLPSASEGIKTIQQISKIIYDHQGK